MPVRSGTYRPEWFRALLRDDPALVADVLCRSAARKLETGVQPATELQELANAEDHREVAELVSLSVLEPFPKAETDVALLALCWSLKRGTRQLRLVGGRPCDRGTARETRPGGRGTELLADGGISRGAGTVPPGIS